ncbi:LOW QUALITY PROTEIN: PPR domain-containing protein/PPR_2 domain-containing protein, partial [Cephalotus follicularis]
SNRTQLSQAISSLELLSSKGIRLPSKILASLINHCAVTKSLKEGKWVHLHMKLTGLKQPSTILCNHLIHMYFKCGSEFHARMVFDKMSVRNVYSWNNLLSGYSKLGMVKQARALFDKMTERDVISWNKMIIGYAQSGFWEEGLRFYRELRSELFDQMPDKNSVSWTAMISGYARNSMGHKALELFSRMMLLPIRPDQFTYSSCLCACASIALLRHGKIHGSSIKTNLRLNAIVVSSLIDMYSKCGNVDVGRQVFEIMGNKQDSVLWNTMISALAQHGRGEEALQMFDAMVRSGMKPNRITLTVSLNACSHSGLVQEGLRYFESMTGDHGIVPSQEHYACLVDLLGRAGCFEELINQLKKMPCKPDKQVLNALLGVCRICGNIELGRKVAEQLIELEPQSS